MDSKEGLVAPVWSDSGEVTFEVSWYSLGELQPVPEGWDITRIWRGGVLVSDFRKPAKPSDPNAKPSLPSLTREGGNKRGPGWCEE